MSDTLKLISMQDVQAEDVQWIWYLYIPKRSRDQDRAGGTAAD